MKNWWIVALGVIFGLLSAGIIFLASQPRHVFKRDQLLEDVWGYSEYLDPGTVTVHMRRLREKLEADPSEPIWLITVWGVGYKFEPGQIE